MIRSPDSGRHRKHRGFHVAAILFVFTALTMAAWSSRAADWSAVSVLSERLEFDDNLGVDIDTPGDIFAATSTATLDITADDPDYRFTANGELSYTDFSGPGSEDEPNSLSETISAGLDLPGPRHTLSFSGSFSRSDTTFTDTLEGFEELGVFTVQTNKISFSGTGNLEVEVDRTNSLTFSASGQSVDFEDANAGLTPFITYGVTTGWSNRVTEATTASLSGSVDIFEADNDENTENVSYTATGQLEVAINERLSVTGLAGVTVIDSTTDVLGVSQSSTSVGPVFDAGFSYSLSDTSLNFSVSQSVSASALGDLRERRSYKMGLDHQVNSRETFSLQASYTSQDVVSGGGGAPATVFVSVSPTYTFNLARYWSLSVGYQFRYRDDETGSATSNKVFGTVSREVTLLP